MYRAVHASAVYHLLVARLDRYLQERKENSDTYNKQFAKVEVIKKSQLSTEKTASRNKGFIYRGKKIDPNSQSNQNISESNDHEDDDRISHNQNLDIPNNDHSVNNQPGKKDLKKLKDEHASSSETNIPTLSPPNSLQTSNKQNETPTLQNQNQTRTKGHRRAISSVNPNELRQAEEIHNKLRNSLCCDSKEDLSKTNENNEQQSPTSPQDPFEKTDEGIVARKKSVDVKLNTVLGSPINGEKRIDVIKLLPESPRKCSNENEKKKMKRKESVDYQINSEVSFLLQ